MVRWKRSIWRSRVSHWLAEFVGDEVGELLRRFVGGGGGALDLLAVLVGAGGEDHRLVTLHALQALDRVGGDGGVGVADVGSGVDVIDRRGEVVFAFEF